MLRRGAAPDRDGIGTPRVMFSRADNDDNDVLQNGLNLLVITFTAYRIQENSLLLYMDLHAWAVDISESCRDTSFCGDACCAAYNTISMEIIVCLKDRGPREQILTMIQRNNSITSKGNYRYSYVFLKWSSQAAHSSLSWRLDGNCLRMPRDQCSM